MRADHLAPSPGQIFLGLGPISWKVSTLLAYNYENLTLRVFYFLMETKRNLKEQYLKDNK